MPSRTVVLCTVALTPDLVGPATPRLKSFADGGAMVPLGGVTPAVTATVQSTYLTGLPPSGHGAVGNGWLFRDTMEARLWQQSNRLVQAPKVWEAAPGITCANLSWWFAMYSSADVTVTPRPMYPADGRKIPDCYTKPGDLRDSLQAELGQFPLFKFWGPAASIDSTKWLAEAAKRVEAQFTPTLSLVYLPHLDYGLQKKGPVGVEKELGEIDGVAGDLIDFYEERGVARDRALRVRDRAGVAAGAPEPRAARRRTDRVPDGARPRGDRHRRERGVRHGRPPALARVRARPRARGARSKRCWRPSPVSARCSTRPASASTGSTTSARASSC